MRVRGNVRVVQCVRNFTVLFGLVFALQSALSMEGVSG